VSEGEPKELTVSTSELENTADSGELIAEHEYVQNSHMDT